MVWAKLDEIIGAGILGTIALTALIIHADGTIIGACVAGIVSLLISQSSQKRMQGATTEPVEKVEK